MRSKRETTISMLHSGMDCMEIDCCTVLFKLIVECIKENILTIYSNKERVMKKICRVMMTILALCMIITNVPVIKAESNGDAQYFGYPTSKDIAVGTEYYIGDTIQFGKPAADADDKFYYLYNGNTYVAVEYGYDVVYTEFESDTGKWRVNLTHGGPLSLWFSSDEGFTGEEIVVGIKCNGGDGSITDPYTFELVYGLKATIKVINGTRQKDYGEDEDAVIENEAALKFKYKYSSKEMGGIPLTLGFLQPNEGYYKPVVTVNGRVADDGYWNAGWNVVILSENSSYPNGWVRISGNLPEISVDCVVEFQPIKYKIAFKNNDVVIADMGTIDATYDKEVQLPACTITNGNLFFDGWNTAVDGSGDYYSDGATVKNLTTKRKADVGDGPYTVVLYAQWSETEDYYFCSEGDGQTWDNGSTGSLDFTFDRSKEDRPVYENRKEIKVDGRTIDASNYEEEEGSWIVKLNADYLNTLSNGRHTIEAVFNDNVSNKTAATFTVQGKETPVTPVPIPKTGID